MKKQFIYGLLSLTVLSGAGLSSCSSEEDFAGPKGQKVMLSITASKDAQTRTSFEETEDGLLCKWTADDKLLVTNRSGQRLGVISLVEGAGNATALFRGPVTLDGNQTVNLFYLGNGKAIPETLTENAYTLDLSAQDGTFASLAANDFMHQEANVTLLNGEATGSVMMDRRVAEGHFDLQLPGGLQLKAGDVVTITQPEGTFYVAPKIKYGTGGSVVGATDNGTLTITKTEDGNDLYVTIFPQTLTPTFTIKKDGSIYTATLGSHDWVQSTYVSNSDGSGVAVELTDASAVDHSKNPLAKWALTNLDLSQADGFAENQWDTGQFFQFGRNCGFSGYSDAQGRYAVYCSKDTDAPWNVWGFNVYNGKGNGSKVAYSYSYSGLTDSNPAEYFFISDTDLQGSSNDYWPQRAYLDDDWSTRATAEGWSKGDPSPEGWHIATTAEYNEIMPAQLSSTNQSSVWGTGEIRKNADCTYAVRWDISQKTLSSTNVRKVLAVKCLVVEPGTKYADVDWNDENVILRYFPSAGYINSGYSNFAYWYPNGYGNNINYWIARQEGVNPGSNYIKAGNQRAALPVPVGLISYSPRQVGSSVAVQYQITENHSNFRTSYWTADGDCFGFSYDLDKQWSDPYFIGTHKTYSKAYGMPLRCVHD